MGRRKSIRKPGIIRGKKKERFDEFLCFFFFLPSCLPYRFFSDRHGFWGPPLMSIFCQPGLPGFPRSGPRPAVHGGCGAVRSDRILALVSPVSRGFSLSGLEPTAARAHGATTAGPQPAVNGGTCLAGYLAVEPALSCWHGASWLGYRVFIGRVASTDWPLLALFQLDRTINFS